MSDSVGMSPPVSAAKSLAIGSLALVAASALAAVFGRLSGSSTASPEKTAALIAVVLVIAAAVIGLSYVVFRRRSLSASELGVVVLGLAIGGLAAVDLYYVIAQVTFPADILIWSESDFVNDIIKLRVGYPFYSAQVNNDSFAYMPGAQVLTFLLASAVGQSDSLTAYRAVQVGFTLGASAFGVLSIRRLLQAAHVTLSARETMVWSAVWFPALFLMATNNITNANSALLHNDALNQLINLFAFWLVVEFAVTRNTTALVVLALLPAMGFLVKQTSAIWMALGGGFLLLFDREPSWRRAIAFVVPATVLIVAAFGLGFALWGQDFIYWVFEVLGKHTVSPVRSVQHALDGGAYFAAGMAGGLMLMRGGAFRTLIGPWLVWLGVLVVETYTSGIAWMLNHMGPGCLLAGVWLLAGATRLWHERLPFDERGGPLGVAVPRWVSVASAVAVGFFCLPALGVVKLPTVPIPADTRRYVTAVEQEFKGLPADQVLIDAGSWMYTPSRVVQKDRAPTIGERGYSGTGDFSGMLQRIREQRYRRILVRHYHEPYFWYEHESWDSPSGIRAALEKSYREVRVIPGVEGFAEKTPYMFSAVSVLEPIVTTALTDSPARP